MKQVLSIFILLLILSCGNKSENKTEKESEIKTDTLSNSTNEKEETKITFEKYTKDGILLNGEITLFDDKLNKIGKIEIKEISKVQILEKSTNIYNIESSKDYCLKSNFIKINYKSKNYTIFGREIYEINDKEKFDFQNEKKENFTIFPITNFEMGGSDDDGLTSCDDFSYLVVYNKTNNKYSTISSPKNQENHSNEKFANLLHDDGSEEKIYHVKMVKDSLILGIKVSYQEEYGSFYLRTSFKDNFKNSIITNKNRFEEVEEYNELK